MQYTVRLAFNGFMIDMSESAKAIEDSGHAMKVQIFELVLGHLSVGIPLLVGLVRETEPDRYR